MDGFGEVGRGIHHLISVAGYAILNECIRAVESSRIHVGFVHTAVISARNCKCRSFTLCIDLLAVFPSKDATNNEMCYVLVHYNTAYNIDLIISIDSYLSLRESF